VIGEIAGVGPDAVEKAGLAPSQEVQPEHVESRLRRDPVGVTDLSARIEHREA
jgi:hypothetical protein